MTQPDPPAQDGLRFLGRAGPAEMPLRQGPRRALSMEARSGPGSGPGKDVARS